jgi:hypothetical protein
VGAYLQIAGMLLFCLRQDERSRASIVLLSSSVCLSLFTAWTILAADRSISPSEAWLILSLSAAYGVPRHCAMTNETESSQGKGSLEYNRGGIAILCCLVSVLWQQVLYFWFFGTLYRELPLLGTDNLVWFFAPVDVGGWFRTLMLVVTCMDSVILVCSVGAYLDLALTRFVEWSGASKSSLSNVTSTNQQASHSDKSFENHSSNRPISNDSSSKDFWAKDMCAVGELVRKFQEGKRFRKFVNTGNMVVLKLLRLDTTLDENNTLEEIEDEIKKTKARMKAWRIGVSVWGFVILVLTIAGVEKIIEYNSLYSPANLAMPGQVIPFILGIITFLVGAAHAIKPQPGDSEHPLRTERVDAVRTTKQQGSTEPGVPNAPPSSFETHFRSDDPDHLAHFIKEHDQASLEFLHEETAERTSH